MSKKIQLIHKEKDKQCFEILKICIVEDEKLKEYRIDKDTLLEHLPESVVNKFLDFLGSKEPVFRRIYLKWIKEGKMVITCEEE